MNFDFSPKTKDMITRLKRFMEDHVYPAEPIYHQQMEKFRAEGNPWRSPPILDELKAKARAEGFWNLFLPHSERGAGLTNVEYAPLCELMGWADWVPEIFNCSAPDTGNMELLERFGNERHKKEYLEPLLEGKMRSVFLMTEPAVASSDATNIETRIERGGDHYVINGRKWWSSGLGDPRCKFGILMGKTNPGAPIHQQQSQVIVPMDAPGIEIIRMLPVFGYLHEPHGHAEVVFENVRVPVENLLLGEGRGFEIAQGRLGPGRIHLCMRLIGAAERALQLMCQRLHSRVAFGKVIAEHSVWEERVARARIDIEMARLLTLKAAYMMDTVGNKVARAEIAMIKVAAPTIALKVIDDAIQAWGGGGVSDVSPLSFMYAMNRVIRISDGPDEVHNRTIAKLEFKKYKNQAKAAAE